MHSTVARLVASPSPAVDVKPFQYEDPSLTPPEAEVPAGIALPSEMWCLKAGPTLSAFRIHSETGSVP